MGEATAISWCDHTFNPWIGCTKISPACDGCYAAALMGEGGRFERVQWGEPGKGAGTRARTSPGNWSQPLKWDRKAQADGVKRFVFCASLADVFDNEVDPEWRFDLFKLIYSTPSLIWLLLTKRPQNIVKMAKAMRVPWPCNAAIGTTIEDRLRLRQNAPALAAAAKTLSPAFTFWSCEPLIEDLGYLGDVEAPGWIITGGETDQGAHKSRPSHPDWFRSIRDQALAGGIPYHHKQNGEWMPCGESIGDWPVDTPGHVRLTREGTLAEHGWPMQRVGKTFSGRMLDGVTHDAMPVVK